VNAYLAEGAVLPVEYQVFRIRPEPWKPEDSVAWLLVMAWDLSGNYRSELARMRFSAALGPERAAQLLPASPTIACRPGPT
jgi:penicillin amidase